MNERIDELLDKAKLTAVQEMFEEELYEFAELIVRECGIALSPMLRDMVSRGHAYDLIKQHFGLTSPTDVLLYKHKQTRSVK